ncbi:triose-phosphate isomerase [Calditrichota bacterium]
MRSIFIAGNWKMNTSPLEGDELARMIAESIPTIDPEGKVKVVLCPPATHFPLVSGAIAGSDVEMGAQNVHWAAEGAFTGELSPSMLMFSGCTFAIIGHSERRQYFGETDETVNKRLKNTLAAGLAPIVCIGETLEEREAGKTFAVLERQLKVGLADVALDGGIVIAYEPVWAIGTGKTASPEQAQEVHKFIRDWLVKNAPEGAADSISILYGGSVNEANADGLLSQPDIDGALVGGASLDAGKFLTIIKAGADV